MALSSNLAPRLPPGTSSTLNALSETFSFHSSPETFIASRALAFHRENPSLAASGTPIRASILGRDVAVISSYDQVMHVLHQARMGRDKGQEHESDKKRKEWGDTYVAKEAYAQFMAPFFPSPNLLLSPGQGHETMRASWTEKMASLTHSPALSEMVRRLTLQHFSSLSRVGESFDIYGTLKSLSWKILLGTFLGLEAGDPQFDEICHLQETLLRGQFSMFPVSVNVGLWQSPRSKGISAKDRLVSILYKEPKSNGKSRLSSSSSSCPFHQALGLEKGKTRLNTEELCNHLLLFTSSLATKSLASLLTAYLLNIFVSPGHDTLPTATRTGLGKILFETERLSPPIVGIMRRAARDNIIPTTNMNGGTSEAVDTLVPQGWDTWLYFVSALRDPSVFGPRAHVFSLHRFDSDLGLTNEAEKLSAFSVGAKKCLGREVVREVCVTVAESLVAERFMIEGTVNEKGVRGWLGWDEDEARPEDWAKDMRQLPTQRPARPVLVRVRQMAVGGI